jgi:hypothetical protein
MDSLSAGTLDLLVEAEPVGGCCPGRQRFVAAYPIIRSGVIDFDRNR